MQKTTYAVDERFAAFIASRCRFNAFLRIASLCIATAVTVMFMFFTIANPNTACAAMPVLAIAWLAAGKMFNLTSGIMRDDRDPVMCKHVVIHSSLISLSLFLFVTIVMLIV